MEVSVLNSLSCCHLFCSPFYHGVCYIIVVPRILQENVFTVVDLGMFLNGGSSHEVWGARVPGVQGKRASGGCLEDEVPQKLKQSANVCRLFL